jgi:hypothetical protein
VALRRLFRANPSPLAVDQIDLALIACELSDVANRNVD